MNCKEVHNNLTDLVGGSLDKDRRAKIIEHLKQCNDCNILADRMKESFRIIEKEKIVEYDPEFINRLESRMAESRVVHMNPIWQITRVAVAVAIVVLGVFSGINIGRFTNEVAVNDNSDEFSEEFYSLNDIYKEPIENFFLLNIEDDEQD